MYANAIEMAFKTRSSPILNANSANVCIKRSRSNRRQTTRNSTPAYILIVRNSLHAVKKPLNASFSNSAFKAALARRLNGIVFVTAWTQTTAMRKIRPVLMTATTALWFSAYTARSTIVGELQTVTPERSD